MTMLLLTNKAETTATAAVVTAPAAAPQVYHKEARLSRMKAVLKTMIKMSAQEEYQEFTIATLGARLKLALLAQIKKGELKESSIKADLNAAIREMGGVVELRREKVEGTRGRPYAVYAFDASTLTTKGRLIKAAIDAEQAKGGKKN